MEKYYKTDRDLRDIEAGPTTPWQVYDSDVRRYLMFGFFIPAPGVEWPGRKSEADFIEKNYT